MPDPAPTPTPEVPSIDPKPDPEIKPSVGSTSDPPPTPGPGVESDPNNPLNWTENTPSEIKEKFLASQKVEGTEYNLLDCYNRGIWINNCLHLTFMYVDQLGADGATLVSGGRNSKLSDYWAAFADACNEGISTFANAVADQTEALWTKGEFIKHVIPISPKRVGLLNRRLQVFTEEEKKNPRKHSGWWKIFTDTLSFLLAQWPSLNSWRPAAGGATYADLFRSALSAGGKFYDEYQKLNSGKDTAPKVRRVLSSDPEGQLHEGDVPNGKLWDGHDTAKDLVKADSKREEEDFDLGPLCLPYGQTFRLDVLPLYLSSYSVALA